MIDGRFRRLRRTLGAQGTSTGRLAQLECGLSTPGILQKRIRLEPEHGMYRAHLSVLLVWVWGPRWAGATIFWTQKFWVLLQAFGVEGAGGSINALGRRQRRTSGSTADCCRTNCPHLHLSICPPISLALALSLSLYTNMYVCIYIYICVYIYTRFAHIYMYACLPIYLSIYLSICPSTIDLHVYMEHGLSAPNALAILFEGESRFKRISREAFEKAASQVHQPTQVPRAHPRPELRTFESSGQPAFRRA